MKQLLIEGLIKVPEHILSRLIGITVKNISFMLSDDLSDEHIEELDKIYYNPKDLVNLKTYSNKVSVVLIRDRYSIGSISKNVDIEYIMDFGNNFHSNKNEHAGQNGNNIFLNMNSIEIMTRLNVFIVKNNITPLLNFLKNSLKHELIHYIESEFFNKPVKSLTRKKGYTDTRSDYMTSKVEYEAQISSAIETMIDWLDFIKTVNGRVFSKKELKDIILYYLSASPSVSFHLVPYHVPRNDFMEDLKQVAPIRYKIALKKFYSEIMQSILSDNDK
jgi:hypothetical protein